VGADGEHQVLRQAGPVTGSLQRSRCREQGEGPRGREDGKAEWGRRAARPSISQQYQWLRGEGRQAPRRQQCNDLLPPPLPRAPPCRVGQEAWWGFMRVVPIL